MPDSTYDHLSLTLPKPKARVRFKKPKMPNPLRLLWLVLSIDNAIVAVQDLVDGDVFDGGISIILCSIYWWGYHRMGRVGILDRQIWIASLIAIGIALLGLVHWAI